MVGGGGMGKPLTGGKVFIGGGSGGNGTACAYVTPAGVEAYEIDIF